MEIGDYSDNESLLAESFLKIEILTTQNELFFGSYIIEKNITRILKQCNSCYPASSVPDAFFYPAGYQESELRYLTFLYTCPLTVLYAAEQAGIRGQPVESLTSLTIHLVGAR